MLWEASNVFFFFKKKQKQKNNTVNKIKYVDSLPSLRPTTFLVWMMSAAKRGWNMFFSGNLKAYIATFENFVQGDFGSLGACDTFSSDTYSCSLGSLVL